MKCEFFKIKMVLLFVLIFQFQMLVGKECSDQDQSRCYISKNDVAICDEGIVILGTQSLIIAESLFHDECGFYFLAAGARWKCNWCGELNPLDRNTCQACGEPYGSSPPKRR